MLDTKSTQLPIQTNIANGFFSIFPTGNTSESGYKWTTWFFFPCHVRWTDIFFDAIFSAGPICCWIQLTLSGGSEALQGPSWWWGLGDAAVGVGPNKKGEGNLDFQRMIGWFQRSSWKYGWLGGGFIFLRRYWVHFYCMSLWLFFLRWVAQAPQPGEGCKLDQPPSWAGWMSFFVKRSTKDLVVATQIFLMFTPNFGKIPHSDQYFSIGLKPPTRRCVRLQSANSVVVKKTQRFRVAFSNSWTVALKSGIEKKNMNRC